MGGKVRCIEKGRGGNPIGGGENTFKYYPDFICLGVAGIKGIRYDMDGKKIGLLGGIALYPRQVWMFFYALSPSSRYEEWGAREQYIFCGERLTLFSLTPLTPIKAGLSGVLVLIKKYFLGEKSKAG